MKPTLQEVVERIPYGWGWGYAMLKEVYLRLANAGFETSYSELIPILLKHFGLPSWRSD